eukprot:5223919-Amphidinium_carterae.1
MSLFLVMVSEATTMVMVIGEIIMQAKFIVANVQPPLIGLPDMDFNEITVHTGMISTLSSTYTVSICKNSVPTISFSLYVAAMVLPGSQIPEEITVDRSMRTTHLPANHN